MPVRPKSFRTWKAIVLGWIQQCDALTDIEVVELRSAADGGQPGRPGFAVDVRVDHSGSCDRESLT